MYLLMTQIELRDALRASKGADSEDALDVRVNPEGAPYILITHRHWQQRVYIICSPDVYSLATRVKVTV